MSPSDASPEGEHQAGGVGRLTVLIRLATALAGVLFVVACFQAGGECDQSECGAVHQWFFDSVYWLGGLFGVLLVVTTSDWTVRAWRRTRSFNGLMREFDDAWRRVVRNPRR
jgi:hypothetical protein